MTNKLHVFVSSVQKELEDERVIVQNLLNTDSFLSVHCVPGAGNPAIGNAGNRGAAQ